METRSKVFLLFFPCFFILTTNILGVLNIAAEPLWLLETVIFYVVDFYDGILHPAF